jgi:hypothetical protein
MEPIIFSKLARQSMSQPVQTTLQQIYHFGGKIQHEISYTPLILLLSTIYYLPYLARKHLLDGCRIQRSQFTNSTLLTGYNLVVEKFTIIYLPGHLIQRIFDSCRGTGQSDPCGIYPFHTSSISSNIYMILLFNAQYFRTL